ncbi:SAM-dependent methyltransferase [Streptomyces sp. NPDC049954]|uniref:SAM-dependent methyltransferase n=1 Tax=Streptomyces sp. NPDC049954 TaxID=3155779 RepID=UPI003448AB19
MTTVRIAGVDIDTTAPHPARVYDCLLGGKDHYPVDQRVAASLPEAGAQGARENREFMRRAVRWLAGQGVDQFLDVGTGIPTEPNLHQVVQSVNPAAHVVYADNDPIVLAHAEALLVSSPEGATHYLQADVREPATILRESRELLDFTRPVALSLIALLHFLPDDVKPHDIVRTLTGALPSGSYLVLSHAASDIYPDKAAEVREGYARGGIQLAFRDRAEVARFHEGLEPVAPGLVETTSWYRDTARPEPGLGGIYAVVARVP